MATRVKNRRFGASAPDQRRAVMALGRAGRGLPGTFCPLAGSYGMGLRFLNQFLTAAI